MQLVEHLWNGRHGLARLDIYLHRDGDRWSVLAREGGSAEGQLWYPDMTEKQARAYVRRLRKSAVQPLEGWRWRNITGSHQQD